MAVDSAMILGYAMPIIKTLIMGIMGVGGTAALAYYLFVVKRRRTWIVDIWEQKADGRIQIVGKDRVIEKKINKGKQVVYLMKISKAEVFPPPWEATHRWKGKEYANYLRLREEDFQPIKSTLPYDFNNKENKKQIVGMIKKETNFLRRLTKAQIDDRYVYAPINKVLTINMEFEAMDYDINMMRINAIDNRDKIYADKQDFWSKYGHFVAIGAIIVLIIVVLYLSYDYSAKVIEAAMGKASETLGMVEQLAGRLGGTAPPS